MIDLTSGVPGVSAPKPISLDEFWPFFVSQHLDPRTRVAHAWGTVTYTAAALGLLLGIRRRWMAGAGLLGGTTQVLSHRVFENNRAADTDRVARPRYDWLLLADYRMTIKTLTARMDSDVAQVRQALALGPDQVTLADARLGPGQRFG